MAHILYLIGCRNELAVMYSSSECLCDQAI